MSYWPGTWSGEDAGPERLARSMAPGPGITSGGRLELAASRSAAACTMVVEREPGQLYLLRHTAGDHAVAVVERLHPESLEVLATSPELPGGPAWPGSLAAHANGSLYVVFGRHAHRLDPDLSLVASATLPADRPYNGFVLLPDGCLVTKDFAGSRPGHPVTVAERQRSELIVLEPEDLATVDSCRLPEPSIARLSASGAKVYVVGDSSLLARSWDGQLQEAAPPVRYRSHPGQGYGWDCVVALGAAWFLDDGEGTEAYDGTLRGKGVATAPLRLWRVDLASGTATSVEICGLPGGVVANPPAVDVDRGLVVGYDSHHGVLAAFRADGALDCRWKRRQDHAGHLVVFPDTGELLTGHYDPLTGDHAVVLDVASGEPLAEVATDSPVQSVLFPAVGSNGSVYLTTFTTVSRLEVVR